MISLPEIPEKGISTSQREVLKKKIKTLKVSGRF